ncbi:MAG: hypothetical protein JJE21_03645 [Spirochaetaceae bacterium]|nr:hypothetical protein [Spirochaetaceae bacterium]
MSQENEILNIKIKEGMKLSEIINLKSLYSKMKSNFKQYIPGGTKHLNDYPVILIITNEL